MVAIHPHQTGPAAPEFFRPAAQPRQVVIADVFDCTVEAEYRVGNAEAADFSCGRHRFEVVAAHWRREPNLPIYDLLAGNGHPCNEVRAAEALRAREAGAA